MSRLSEADVQKSCKPKDAATEGFCFQQTMIRVKVNILRVFYILGQWRTEVSAENRIRRALKFRASEYLCFLGYCKIIGILYWCAWNATDC